MKTCRLFQFILLNIVLFKQISNVLTHNNNILNTLLMQFTQNPYKWESKQPDFKTIILNEQLVKALNNQEPPITDIQVVYNKALSYMYEKIPVQDLVELLWKIYEKYDLESYITMTRAQLALYWRYRLDEIQDPNYVLLAAHCFYKIKNDVFFTRLNPSTQHLVNSTLQSLPSSLQYLFGRQEFCLNNQLYSEVLYQTLDLKINGDTSQVLSTNWNKINASYMGLIQPLFEKTKEDNLADLNVALHSKHLKGYFHRLPQYANAIGANNLKHKLRHFLWSVELVDNNQLVFTQDDYLLCRQDSGVIYGLSNKTIYDGECQWSAGDCNSPLTLYIYSKNIAKNVNNDLK